jgi:hypothetical protein
MALIKLNATQGLTGALPAISGASLTGLTSAQIPAGSVIQVQSTRMLVQNEGAFSNATTVMTQAITPIATSSKILVMVNMTGCLTRDETTQAEMWIERDGSSVCRIEDYIGQNLYAAAHFGMDFLDSPSSTSALSYTVRVQRKGGTANIAINHYDGGSTANVALYATSSLILMEIAG